MELLSHNTYTIIINSGGVLMDTVEIRFDKLAKEFLHLSDEIDYNSHIRTYDIDSLKLLSFIIEIENTFEVEFDDTDLMPQNLNSFSNILKLLKTKLPMLQGDCI